MPTASTGGSSSNSPLSRLWEIRLASREIIGALPCRAPRSVEDHGLVAVHDHPVFQVVAQGPGQHHLFHILSQPHQVLHPVRVVPPVDAWSVLGPFSRLLVAVVAVAPHSVTRLAIAFRGG